MALKRPEGALLPDTMDGLLTDPTYVRQWGEYFCAAARAVTARITDLHGQDFVDARTLLNEVRARCFQDGQDLTGQVAAASGLLGQPKRNWGAVDFSGGAAILGPHPSSVESQLRRRYPAVYAGLPPFVVPYRE